MNLDSLPPRCQTCSGTRRVSGAWCPDCTPAQTPEAKRGQSVIPKNSFPPGKKSSYGLALSLLGMAASSAMGIPNPLHRTAAILACAVALYIIGLRTPTTRS